MASSSYMSGRQKYSRPQAMLWATNSGKLENGIYIPNGNESTSAQTGTRTYDFIILSDHNRGEININTQRLEQRKRMANGTMRSYHIADKLQISTSWQMIPSRAYSSYPGFNQSTGLSIYDIPSAGQSVEATEYTADGGAGGVEMLDWYENHTGPFWVYLAYDKYTNLNQEGSNLAEYNQVLQMYITNFDYSIVKRSGTKFDLWNVNVTLEEV
jgi:hypothetical protein